MHLYNLPTSIAIGNALIPFKQSVKNLGFILDGNITMNAHFSTIAGTCYFELCRLASVNKFLTNTATVTLNISAFVLSTIDYNNPLLFGSTHDVTSCFQRIQNSSSNLVHYQISEYNYTFKIISLASCQGKKTLLNSLFVLPLFFSTATAVLHHHISLTCCRKAVTHLQHSLQYTHHASSQ